MKATENEKRALNIWKAKTSSSMTEQMREKDDLQNCGPATICGNAGANSSNQTLNSTSNQTLNGELNHYNKLAVERLTTERNQKGCKIMMFAAS